MNALGIQLILDLKECDPRLLDDLPYIRQTLIDVAHEIGAHIVGETFHKFSPQGVTGVLAISESHIAIHTWPEFGYAAVDIFTCNPQVDVHRAVHLVVGRLRCAKPRVVEVKRGVLAEMAEARA